MKGFRKFERCFRLLSSNRHSRHVPESQTPELRSRRTNKLRVHQGSNKQLPNKKKLTRRRKHTRATNRQANKHRRKHYLVQVPCIPALFVRNVPCVPGSVYRRHFSRRCVTPTGRRYHANEKREDGLRRKGKRNGQGLCPCFPARTGRALTAKIG